MKNNKSTQEKEVQECISFLVSLGYTVTPPKTVSSQMEEVIQDWLSYKRERHQTYKPRGLASFIRRLNELSGGDAQKARAVIEQSMANNYSGIFELKEDRNGTTRNRLAAKAATILSE